MTALKHLNTLTVALRWLDLDAYGHVGNSRYYDLMTDARVALLGAEAVLTDRTKQYVVAESGCRFLQPLHYPGKVIVKQFCKKLGNSSFTLGYEFSMESDPETLCAEGFVVIVSYDAKLKKAVRVPEVIRSLLA
jgi:acyl-CoA thioester hydrolase